jgi:hypothetical protein
MMTFRKIAAGSGARVRAYLLEGRPEAGPATGAGLGGRLAAYKGRKARACETDAVDGP